MSTTQERAEMVKNLTPSIQGLDGAAQTKAIDAVIQPPGEQTANLLWKILIAGLVALAAIALLGVILLPALDKSADPAVTAFTALLTGLIGFFAPSPVAKKTEQPEGNPVPQPGGNPVPVSEG